VRSQMIAAAGAVALLLAALPVNSASSSDTNTTFTVTSGLLSISSPASKALGAGPPNGTITSQLGAVTVSDARGVLNGSWTATVSTTDFITGGGTAAETISKPNVSYWSGAATASSGIGVFVPGQATALNAQALGITRTAFSASAVVGNNSVTWNPTIVVSVPAAAVAGDYAGVITHSVS
jgi:hypothetical protein